MELQWDASKERRNIRLHGVNFNEARTTFFDPLAMVRLDRTHSEGEERFMLVGRSEAGRLLVTIFAERGSDIRIISSRLATKREIRGYEE